MTNRDRLIGQIAQLTNGQIVEMLNDNNMYDRIDCIMCKECKMEHGGKCPAGDDVICILTEEEWLGQEFRREWKLTR